MARFLISTKDSVWDFNSERDPPLHWTNYTTMESCSLPILEIKRPKRLNIRFLESEYVLNDVNFMGIQDFKALIEEFDIEDDIAPLLFHIHQNEYCLVCQSKPLIADYNIFQLMFVVFKVCDAGHRLVEVKRFSFTLPGGLMESVQLLTSDPGIIMELPCFEEEDASLPHSLYKYIDLPKVTLLCHALQGNIKAVFNAKRQRVPYHKRVESGAGYGLLVFIPFKSEVNIKSIFISGGRCQRFKSKVKVFLNRSVFNIKGLNPLEPDEEWEFPGDPQGICEHRTNLQHVCSITLYYIEQFIVDSSAIFYIGFEGEATQENLQLLLTGSGARDQFLVYSGLSKELQVQWSDGVLFKPVILFGCQAAGSSLGDPVWSSRGTYLASPHPEAVLVYGGVTMFHRPARYCYCPNVKLVRFSPGERFLVAYSDSVTVRISSDSDSYSDSDSDSDSGTGTPRHWAAVHIFDVKTGKRLWQCVEESTNLRRDLWPDLRWVGGVEDAYFSIKRTLVYVYETKTFTLLDKKPLNVKNVKYISWSPTDPILALFVPELNGGSQPARVSLIHVPGKEELKQKHLFNVINCKLYWQSKGKYLAVEVKRYTETKKIGHTILLFRIKEQGIPIEILELGNENDMILAFSWEPNGERFAVIHGDSLKSQISFYIMQSSEHSGQVSRLATFNRRQINSLSWSPRGCLIVFVELNSLKGQLEFFNVDELQTIKSYEEFVGSNAEWDPTGRYFATYVTSHHEMENKVQIWSSKGDLVYQQQRDHLYQFSWRRRPPSHLSEAGPCVH